MRLQPSRQASFVEILERPGVPGSPDGRAFEDIFQITVVVAVESANGQNLLGTSELSALETIFPASLLKDHVQATAEAAEKLENRFRLRFENGLHHQVTAGIANRRGDRCLVNIEPNILGVVHEGAPCCR